MMTVQDTQAPSGTDQMTVAAATADATLPPVITDPDDLELQEAEAAAKAEEAAGQAKTEQGTEPGTAATTTEVLAKELVKGMNPDAIPYPRFVEVNNKLREKELEVARLQGRLEATTQPAATTATPSQPTAEQRIAEIDTEIDKIAKAYDDGELSYSDMKRQERVFEAQKHALREEQLLARVPKPQAASADPGDGLYLHQKTEEVGTQHPWVDVYEKLGTDADWVYLNSLAQADMQERGIDTSNRAVADLELRKTMGRLMDELGPTSPIIAARAAKQGIALPNGQKTPPPAQPQPKPLSPAAQARAGKLDLAANAPPNLNAMSGTTGDGTPSAAAIEAMSEEDIAALPRAVQDKILGLTAA